ncbi:MAG TPA: nuclear transport factor 2 family protein [Solirubrobacterales bacterium]|jgi:ketosteroid isomerase-like protein|nr:nuclear transport factor 2 family protein [Solirubrobacterales bacterium]
MAGHIDLLRERYQQFGEGDVATATQEWADDLVWLGSGDGGLPGGGEHRGKAAALAALREAVGAWDQFGLVMEEFLEDGDTIVALGHSEVRKGQECAQLPAVHTWRWRGDEVISVEILTDTLRSAHLLGIA